ncbi:MAG: hypothetical protein V7K98_05995 [Nostoc sp.]|uniref:hypothetical protein n=1 Tax=Nostoc sp. TaxID=1180 RepID=UPI002FF54C2E
MKNSTHKGMEFLGMGNRALGMGKKLPMPNAQCPIYLSVCFANLLIAPQLI